ncbi:MAG: hypothetical protein ACOYXR_06860 [Nitrospirota bacterium]
MIANIAQQGSALLLLVTIPNVLSVEHFAEVVFVGVVLSFTRFSDLGLSSVYGRDMPVHHAANAWTDIDRWNRTMFWFGLLGGGVAGVIAAVVMWVRFGTLADAAIVALLPGLTAVTTTYVSMTSVRGDFLAYRNAQIGLSLSRLLAIPFVFVHGLFGWLAAQVASLVLVAWKLGTAWIPRPAEIDWALLRGSLPAALQLAAISLLWTQLLDSARLLAAMHYSPDGIAIYGLLTTGYQSAYALIISAYLPVSVKTLGMLGRNDRAATVYLFDVINRSLPVVFVLAVSAAELSPWVLRVMFPTYEIDPVMPKAILYGLTVIPFVATVGNLFIGKQRNGPYLVILVVSLATTVVLEQWFRETIGLRAAAVAQASGTVVLAVLLVTVARYLFAEAFAEARAHVRSAVIRLAGLWAVYGAIKMAWVWR